MKIPSFADPALIFIRGKTKDEDAPERNSFSTRRLHSTTPTLVTNYFFVRLRKDIRDAAIRRHAVPSYLSLSFALSFFIPIPILSSGRRRGEKMDLPIMGNRYEREHRTTQGVVCTSAATSQTRARINRDT